MRRALAVLVALPLLWLGGRALVRAFASDETRIRWMLASMEEGYNTGDVGDAVAPLHRDWSHEGTELDRDLIRAGLARELFQDRDPRTKKLRRRVELDPGSVEVAVGEDGADVALVARFARLDPRPDAGAEDEAAWGVVWTARIEAELVRTDDGWRILRSRHADVEGTQLSR